jgi:hypothetical protein
MFTAFKQCSPRFRCFDECTWRAIAVMSCLAFGSAPCLADVLVDERFADGSRAESNRPAEAAVWTGRKADVSVAKGALSTKMGESSQKIWLYFTDTEPVTLAVSQTLTASVSFIPRQVLPESTSRSLRIGVFHDATSPRVEDDVNNDGGGAGAPWTDAQGYAVQVLVTGGEYSGTKPFDLGKRTNLASPSLLGTSGDYTKLSGGEPVVLALDKEYRVTLEITKVSDKHVELTSSLYQGDEQLSTFSLSDDGSLLGATPINDKFDQLFIRIADNATTADQIDFTNFKIELAPTAKSAE